MTDIVERLRQPDTYLNHFENALEAADEIERLRDQIATVSAMNVKLVEAHEVVVAERDAAVEIIKQAKKTMADARHYHRSILTSLPPQDAWDFYGMDQRLLEVEYAIGDLLSKRDDATRGEK